MKSLRLSLFLLLGTLLGCATARNEGRMTTLFDGQSLKNWAPMHDGEWTVQDGVLIGRHGTNWTTNPEKSGSWLRSKQEYGDFILELDYAINTRGNSGIFFRSALDKNPAFTGHEVQILDDHGSPPRKFTTGSLYDVVAPAKNMSKPAGQWNTVKIVALGARIQVVHNGEPIVDYQSDRSRRGYIGLQSHDAHAVVKFRHIRITEP